MVIPGNDLIAGSALTLGMIQMIIHAINTGTSPVDEHTMYLLYMGIIGNILWMTYQYRKGENYSVMYSTVALLSQLYILYKVSSTERSREKQSLKNFYFIFECYFTRVTNDVNNKHTNYICSLMQFHTLYSYIFLN